ncbi:virion envelope protein [Pigeonpox virus]|uniref:Virion envelope protein n=1 Tax=Pigeonpox virus TaxID=10264 RepID=A0A068EGD8_9POXV|nr:virion envelope protein [Pigeonpox virus]AID46685.1 virion envelope protein [Pigeonpox virus]WCL40126.1 virion envelope protein [Pigeonpox virus]WIK87557.1 virion envelope protein [Oriental turtle dovepox virus]
MDPLSFFRNRPSYVVVFGIILLIVACICAYIELSKSGKPADSALRSISIISFILAILLLLGILLFSGYNRFCTNNVIDESRYATSPGTEIQ